jgi:hypothetical protein
VEGWALATSGLRWRNLFSDNYELWVMNE